MNFKLLGFALIVLALAVPNFLPFAFYEAPQRTNLQERFEPSLVAQITSVDDLLAYADREASKSQVAVKPSLEYADLLCALIQSRFYHGYSHYKLSENWMAALCGKWIWSDLSAIVWPDDILKYPYAACSQQAIVLIECFKRRGIPTRVVGFAHHFALEGKFGTEWIYFDPNMEPDFSKVGRHSIDQLVKTGEVADAHHAFVSANGWSRQQGKAFFTPIFLGQENAIPAPRARVFHLVTGVLSRFLWLLVLLAGVFLRRRHA
jgi:hypothetical protein